MALHDLAGQPVPPDNLVSIPRLVTAYFTESPDVSAKKERVSFGTSGHRGSSFERTFNEDHILAVSQAVAEVRAAEGISGPLFLGVDTHALSEAAAATTLEVLAANGVNVVTQVGGGYTPTPVISHAILTHSQSPNRAKADGVVLTPSHNPPEDGGFKYNPPTGGPAGDQLTGKIQDRANELLKNGLKGVKRIPLRKAREKVVSRDFIRPYVDDLNSVINMDAIAAAGISIGVDPMGGSGIGYWEPIADEYGLDLEVVNKEVDPTFRFMRIDKDGKIRMDCSSPYAMAGLVDLKDRFDIAFGNDPDFDRHGIVTPSVGLMNPNHYLAVAIKYLIEHRDGWPDDAQVGKTLVSSSMIDRVVKSLGRSVREVPVGFKWFVDDLLQSAIVFGGEESAGASFLRKNGKVWTTDKDGIILNLLAAEIAAVTDRDPGEHYADLTATFGEPVYKRVEAPATLDQKAALKKLSPDTIAADQLAGETIEAKLTKAPGNNANIGGLKVVTENGWFAARPSGTEAIYKIYAESFKGENHLNALVSEAQSIVQDAFEAAGVGKTA